MEEHELTSRVEDLGLSNKEARVYLACLSIGAASVQAIADRAGIKRVTAYVILESLLRFGLVTQTVRAKKTYFMAEEPIRLEQLLYDRAKELDRQRETLSEILPRLGELRLGPRELPEVKFYDGADALKALFKDFFTTYRGGANEFLLMRGVDFTADLRGVSWDEADAGRLARGIKCRLLYASSQGLKFATEDKKLLRLARSVAGKSLPITGDLGILGNTVLMISTTATHPTGVTVRNSEIAHSMKSLFDMAWGFAGRAQS